MENKKKRVKVVLYCKENNMRQIYLDEMERLSANYQVAESFEELEDMAKNEKFNGVLVDVSTIMRAPKKDRLRFQQLKDLYPVVQLNWNQHEKSIGTLFYGKSSDTDDLESFINREAIPFKARSIRKDARKNMCLNTLVSRDPGFKGKVEKTVTIDLSRTGCFIYTVSQWVISDYVWFLFKEIDLKTPIKGRIRRISPWGKAMKLPGLGVSFDEIQKDQLDQIIEMIDNFIASKMK